MKSLLLLGLGLLVLIPETAATDSAAGGEDPSTLLQDCRTMAPAGTGAPANASAGYSRRTCSVPADSRVRSRCIAVRPAGAHAPRTKLRVYHGAPEGNPQVYTARATCRRWPLLGDPL